jgi:hypothetical protein
VTAFEQLDDVELGITVLTNDPYIHESPEFADIELSAITKLSEFSVGDGIDAATELLDVRYFAFDWIGFVGCVLGTAVFLQIRSNRLIGDEIVLDRVDIDTVTFEASTDTSLVCPTVLISQQPIGVFDLSVKRMYVCLLERLFEESSIEIRCQIAEAAAVFFRSPEPFQLCAQRVHLIFLYKTGNLATPSPSRGRYLLCISHTVSTNGGC